MLNNVFKLWPQVTSHIFLYYQRKCGLTVIIIVVLFDNAIHVLMANLFVKLTQYYILTSTSLTNS